MKQPKMTHYYLEGKLQLIEIQTMHALLQYSKKHFHLSSVSTTQNNSDSDNAD